MPVRCLDRLPLRCGRPGGRSLQPPEGARGVCVERWASASMMRPGDRFQFPEHPFRWMLWSNTRNGEGLSADGRMKGAMAALAAAALELELVS
jgi:hypothetical protein